MKRTYEVTDGTDRRAIAEFLKREGQFLLPMVDLVDRAELAIESEPVGSVIERIQKERGEIPG